jgi:hypothetical protein
MTNWQADKYLTLMALNSNDAMNILWRSTTLITPRYCSFATIQKNVKGPLPPPPFNRPQGNHFGQNNHGRCGSFRGIMIVEVLPTVRDRWVSLMTLKQTLKVIQRLTFMTKL